MARQGAIDSPPKTPFIMGSECAGDIEQVGEGVENFKVSEPSELLPKVFFNNNSSIFSEIIFKNVSICFLLNSFYNYTFYNVIKR